MATLYEVVYKSFYSYRWVLLTLVLLVLFSIILYFIYQKSLKPIANSPYSDVANSQQRGIPIQVMFFYVDWCPHCKTAKPEWEAFRSEYDGKIVNDLVVECISKNCTNEKDLETQGLVAEYGISAYPHIILIMPNKNRIEFDAKITKASLEAFVFAATQ